MIQIVAFDLPLLTACTDDPIQDIGAYEEQAYNTFKRYRDQLQAINAKLMRHSALDAARLGIPLTSDLSDGLHLLWAVVPYSHLRKLRTIIMALLSGRNQQPGLIVWLNDAPIGYAYQLSIESGGGERFFPAILPEALCRAWTIAVGDCAFGRGLAEPQTSSSPIGAVWIVSDRTLPQAMCLTRTPQGVHGAAPEEALVPILTRPDAWAWERNVRRALWNDDRLPYGPIGYYPPEGWQTGQRPSRYGYHDCFGGVWQWEGGRAMDERNSFGGHWNVQLPDASVRRRWVNWIQQCTGRTIATSPDRITHINIEPDGCIGDMTFEWQE